MATLTLRAIKAKHGDALFLLADNAKILIDGGPSGVYNQALKQQLLNLDRDDNNKIFFDLMMVSHIDADHIDGILDLTAELIEARQEDRDPVVEIGDAWHNSFSDMIATTAVESRSVAASAASVASTFSQLASGTFNPMESKLVLSSVSQGRQLRLDLKMLNIDLNNQFAGRIVVQEGAATPWSKGNLSLSVIGPSQAQVDDLRIEWVKQLQKILAAEGDASVAAAGALDTSVSNLASIVAIAKADDKTVLLTGDARGDMILNWLEATGWMAPGEKVHFDIVKLPHHGSDRNVTPEFFERITADHYVVCGNGGHGNPEPGMFDMLFTARPDLDYKIHMTYGPDELKVNKKFKKVGNVEKFDAVFSDPRRLGILNFPGQNQTHIDIVL